MNPEVRLVTLKVSPAELTSPASVANSELASAREDALIPGNWAAVSPIELFALMPSEYWGIVPL